MSYHNQKGEEGYNEEDMNEQEIIQLLFRRDEDVLKVIEQQYGALCLRSALRITSDEEMARECVNDALLHIWNHIPPYRPDSFQAYLLKTVRQIVIDRLRKETAKKRGGKEEILAIDDVREEILSIDNLWDRLEQEELNRAVAEFVKTLSDQDRKMFLLRYWQMEKPEMIAETLGLTVGTVNVKLHRIRKECGLI